MKALIYCAVIVAVLSNAVAGGKTGGQATQPRRSQFVFSLLPKSFQKNPRLDFNVFTEVTREGRKQALPTAAAPVYYVAHLTKAESRGMASQDVDTFAPKPEQIEQMLAQALRGDHYLPAAKGTPQPALVLFVHWGSFSNPVFGSEDLAVETVDPDKGNSTVAWQRGGRADALLAETRDPEENEALASQAGSRSDPGSTALELAWLALSSPKKLAAVHDRARLIGGPKFARELAEVLQAEAALLRANDSLSVAQAAARINHPERDSLAALQSLMSTIGSGRPLALFMRRDEHTERMVEEIFSDSFYVVVSAVEYKAVARREPVLLWRTRLSLNSIGVTLGESLPHLVAAGSGYFGRETEQAVLLTKRVSRGARVDIGEARVDSYFEPEKNASPPGEPTKK